MIKVSPTRHLHSLLLGLDYNDLPSRTCPWLFTNTWGLCRVDKASLWECFTEGQMWSVATCQRVLVAPGCAVVPTGGPARLGYLPKSHWLVLNFPAAQEGKFLGWPAQPVTGRTQLSTCIHHIPAGVQSLTSFNFCPCKHFIDPLCPPLPSGVGKEKPHHGKRGRQSRGPHIYR